MIKRTILFWGLSASYAFSGIESEHLSPLSRIGNFTYDRQPNTNFGFGQNILTKNSSLTAINLVQQKGHNANIFAVVPQFLYGITSALSLNILLPILPINDLNYCKATGIGNLITQLEYAFYQKQGDYIFNQATIVANITYPTAHTWSSCLKGDEPSAGFNATSFFLGVTASHLSTYWYTFASPGIYLTTTNHSTKQGNIFFYQAGFGRYLTTIYKAIAVLLLDINGSYIQKTTTNGITNNNTGGNIIFMGPSLSITANQWEIKGGIQFPAYQRFNNTQNKQSFQSLISISLVF